MPSTCRPVRRIPNLSTFLAQSLWKCCVYVLPSKVNQVILEGTVIFQKFNKSVAFCVTTRPRWFPSGTRGSTRLYNRERFSPNRKTSGLKGSEGASPRSSVAICNVQVQVVPCSTTLRVYLEPKKESFHNFAFLWGGGISLRYLEKNTTLNQGGGDAVHIALRSITPRRHIQGNGSLPHLGSFTIEKKHHYRISSKIKAP